MIQSTFHCHSHHFKKHTFALDCVNSKWTDSILVIKEWFCETKQAFCCLSLLSFSRRFLISWSMGADEKDIWKIKKSNLFWILSLSLLGNGKWWTTVSKMTNSENEFRCLVSAGEAVWDNQLVNMDINKHSLKNNGTIWESSWYYPVKLKTLTLNNISPGYKPKTFTPVNIRIIHTYLVHKR